MRFHGTGLQRLAVSESSQQIVILRISKLDNMSRYEYYAPALMSIMNTTSQLEAKRYISVETFKKSGKGVKTPVWFVIRDKTIFVLTRNQTGKFKRLKNNTKVNLAICSMRGDIKGEWVSGTAAILADDKIKEIVKLRDKKYGFISKLARFMSKGKGELCAFSIKID